MSYSERGPHPGDTGIREQEVTEADMRKRLEQTREISERENINDRVRYMLHQVEVMGIITGIKPASSVDFHTCRAMEAAGAEGAEHGQSEEDIEHFTQIAAELGLGIYRPEYDASGDNPASIELFEIYDPRQVEQVMQSSSLFSSNDVQTFRDDPENFYEELLEHGKDRNLANSRDGLIYGYPENDVRAFMRIHDIVNRHGINTWDMTYMQESIRQEIGIDDDYEYYGGPDDIQPKEYYKDEYQINDEDWKFLLEHPIGMVHIYGALNSVHWTTYNRDSEEVQAKIRQFETMTKLQKEVFGFE